MSLAKKFKKYENFVKNFFERVVLLLFIKKRKNKKTPLYCGIFNFLFAIFKPLWKFLFAEFIGVAVGVI